MKKKILLTVTFVAICSFAHGAEQQNNQSPLQSTHSLLQTISNQNSPTPELSASSSLFNSPFETASTHSQIDFSTNTNEQNDDDKNNTNNAVLSVYDKIEKSNTPEKTKFTVETFGYFPPSNMTDDRLDEYLSSLKSSQKPQNL